MWKKIVLCLKITPRKTVSYIQFIFAEYYCGIQYESPEPIQCSVLRIDFILRIYFGLYQIPKKITNVEKIVLCLKITPRKTVSYIQFIFAEYYCGIQYESPKPIQYSVLRIDFILRIYFGLYKI